MARLILPVKVRYTLNSKRSVMVESIRKNYPDSPVYEFSIDDKPLVNHCAVSEHLADRGIDLTAEGKPNRGWIDIQLSDHLVSFKFRNFYGFILLWKVSLNLFFSPSQATYWSEETEKFHFNGSFLDLDPAFGPVGAYDLAQKPAEFVSNFSSKYSHLSAVERMSKFVCLVPADIKMELIELTLDGSLDDLYGAFVNRYESKHEADVRRVLDLRWNPDNNLQLFVEQKMKVYAEIGMTFKSSLNMLRLELGKQSKLIDLHTPKNDKHLKKVAALYDHAQSLKTSEQFREGAASRLDFDLSEMDIEEVDPVEQSAVGDEEGGSKNGDQPDGVLGEELDASQDEFESLAGSVNNNTLVLLGKQSLKTFLESSRILFFSLLVSFWF